MLVAALVSLAFTSRGPEPLVFVTQVPPATPAATQTDSGLIVGRVVEASGDAPVGGALVTLVVSPASGVGTLGPEHVLADSRGQFFFQDLPKGTVTLTVWAPGYLPGGYGQRKPSGTTVPFELAHGQRVSDVTLRLWKFAALGGTVDDEFGEPVVGVAVRVLEVSRTGGPRHLVPGVKAVTDDRGVFRFSSLEPGDYLVAVPSMAMSNPAFPMPVYPTSFYPSALLPSQAVTITLGSGEERSDIDLTLQTVQAVSVSGLAWKPDGPASNFALHLVPTYPSESVGDSGFEAAPTITDARGAFTFSGVPPGQYVLQGTAWSPVREHAAGPSSAARPVSSETAFWGQTAVSVGASDVVDVPLILRPGLSVSGRLSFVGTSPLPAADDLEQLSIGLTSADGRRRGPEPTAHVAADGQFTLRGYLPGLYVVNVPSPGSPWTVVSMTVNGHDVLRTPLAMDSDVTGLVITLTDRPTQVVGVVQRSIVLTATDEPLVVVIFPTDFAAALESGMLERRSRSATVSAARRFAVDGLPAGDYLLAAIPSDLAATWTDADLVAAIARHAARVSLADGDRKTVNPPVVTIR